MLWITLTIMCLNAFLLAIGWYELDRLHKLSIQNERIKRDIDDKVAQYNQDVTSMKEFVESKFPDDVSQEFIERKKDRSN